MKKDIQSREYHQLTLSHFISILQTDEDSHGDNIPAHLFMNEHKPFNKYAFITFHE